MPDVIVNSTVKKQANEIKEKMDIMVLAQNITQLSIDVVFRDSANIGLVLNRAYNLNIPEMETLTTWQEVVNSIVAMTAIANSSIAMENIAGSKLAMSYMSSSSVSVTAIEASATAITALYNSPLKVTSVLPVERAWTTRLTGRIWLISLSQSQYTTTSTLQTRYTIKDNSTVSKTLVVTYNTNVRVDRFMTGIENYTSHSSLSEATYEYIPAQ